MKPLLPYISVLLGLLVLLTGLRLVFDFNGLYGQDAFEYHRYAGELKDFWLGAAMPADFFWPAGYPLAGSLLAVVTGSSSLALQLISLLSLFAVFVYATRTLQLLYPQGRHIFTFCGLFIFCSPFFLRAGFLCMSDMMAACFVTACFSHFVFYSVRGSWMHFSLCLAFGAAACLVRYGSLMMIVIPCAAACITFMRRFSLKGLLLAGVLLSGILFIHYHFRSADPLSFTQHTFLSSWSVQNLFRNAWITPDEGLAFFSLYNLVFYFSCLFHPAFLFYSVLLLPWLFTNMNKVRSIFLLSVCVYLLFLSGMPTQNKRYVILCVPAFTLLMYPAYEAARSRYRSVKRIQWALPLVSAILCVMAFGIIYHRMAFEKNVYGFLKTQHPDKAVYTFDIEVALRGYRLPQKVVSLWTEDLQNFDRGALVLVNEKKFNKQWRLHRLMKNWNRLQTKHGLKPLHNFGEGWELYEIL